MHYTLLTPNERKQIHKEYRVRALVVFCFTMAIVGIIGMVSLFPAYMEAYGYENEEIQNSAIRNGPRTNVAFMKNELAGDAVRLGVLRAYVGTTNMSEIISQVLGLAVSMKITSIDIEPNTEKSVYIFLRGIAPTRTDILELKSKLEASKGITQVEFPISELTKSVSVPFSLRITRTMP